ncbi:MAG: glycosyltransferase family 9 protein, partial [Deltaproteobacteria bacterium]|nr:glycosyltransferase family 9 protein [Deltaproteobacteria bacterium]
MHILLVNLTRFGDLLQSAAALRSLADGGDGGNRVGLVCLDNFAAGAALLEGVTEVHPLPAGKIMAKLNARNPDAEKDAAWLQGVASLQGWVDTVRSRFSPDMVCNLSPTIPACLLSRLLAAGTDCAGFTLDAFGFMHNASPWASFMQSATAARGVSPFNIVDLFRKIAGDASAAPNASLLPPPEESRKDMERRLRQASPDGAAGFVALQPGASAASRQWPVASFAAVGDALWEKHRLLPLLLGTKNERPLAEAYASLAAGPHHSLMGETNITELAAALSLSSLLVSNDTGTLHLASGLGLPVIGIYLATAQPWDTGPYAPGNCSLEPDLPCHPCDFGTRCAHEWACHTAIRPETVIRLALAKLSSGSWGEAANFAASGAAQGSRVWKSRVDAWGFADLASLSGHEHEGRTSWLRIQRPLYRQFFDSRDDEDFTPDPSEAVPSLGGEKGLALARSCDEVLPLFDALLQQ